MEVSPDTLQVMITEGLTEDAVSARIHKGASWRLLLLVYPARCSLLTRVRDFASVNCWKPNSPAGHLVFGTHMNLPTAILLSF